MDGLAEVLELLYSARDRVTTFQATIYTWHHLALNNEAQEKWERIRRSKPGRYSWSADDEPPPPTGPLPETQESTSRLWFHPPARWRHEMKMRNGAVHVEGTDGNLSWRYNPRDGLSAHPEPKGEGRSYIANDSTNDLILDPSALIPIVRFQRIERAVVAGREAIVVTGRRHETIDEDDPDLLWPGSAWCEWTVDAEYGVLLRDRGYLHGRLYGSAEMRDVVFNQPLSADLFIPPGHRR